MYTLIEHHKGRIKCCHDSAFNLSTECTELSPQYTRGVVRYVNHNNVRVT